MTTEPLDPPRIDEKGPDALRTLVRTRREGPSAEDLEKMSERLAALGVLQASSSGRTPLHTTRPAYLKIGVVALLAVGGLLVTWDATRLPAASPGVTTAVTAEPAPETAPGGPALPAVPATTQGISVNELPSAAPAPAVLPSSSASPANDVQRPHARASLTELELVQRAEAALASDPRHALDVASEHARTFPSGEFLQEREVIAVDALARLGRRDESLRRARALVERFPRTPYAARLEMAVGEPLLPTSKSAGPSETKTH